MKARITLSMGEGKLDIWVNEAGRDLLVRELQNLSKQADHFHLGPEDLDWEVSLQTRPYRDGDVVVKFAKVLLRPDEWDAEHYPHVLTGDPTP